MAVKALSLLLCMGLLSACAAIPQTKMLLASPPEALPATAELTRVPFYPQSENQCGPAALATVLQFHGVKVRPEDLSKLLYIPDLEGSLQIEMTAAARAHAMLPYPLAPYLVDLLTEIAAGNPVLVLQNLGFAWYPQWHYSVVVGYDIRQREITLRSGTTKRWTTPFKVFERTWQRSNFWALVVLPIGEIAKTAEPVNYLKAAYDLEILGHSRLALKAYQAATEHWPEVATPWLTLGNLAYSEHNWPEAISAFSAAASIAPESVESWNNLAYALNAQGCKQQSEIALKCALKIAPDDPNLQDSWQDLMLGSVSGDQAGCPVVLCK